MVLAVVGWFYPSAGWDRGVLVEMGSLFLRALCVWAVLERSWADHAVEGLGQNNETIVGQPRLLGIEPTYNWFIIS